MLFAKRLAAACRRWAAPILPFAARGRGWPLGGAALALAGALAVGCGGSVTRVDPFHAQRLIAFGDEYSLLVDAGQTGNGRHYGINALSSTDTTNATPLCSTSGQQVWVQLVASLYGLTFAECNPNQLTGDQLNALMRARLGARVEEMAQEVAAFESGLDGGFRDTDITTVLIGLHDLLEIYNDDSLYPGQDAKLAEARARGERAAALVNRIADQGPRVLVSLLNDVGLTPYAQNRGSDAMAMLTALTNAFNRGLEVKMSADGHKVGMISFAQTSRDYNNSSSYVHDVPACDADHRNTDTHASSQVQSEGDLLNCSTATLVSDTALTTYLWADELRPNARLLQNQLGLLARARATANPF